MLVTTIRPRLAAMARMASIRSERPVPMVSTTTSHIRPQVTPRIRSNAATTSVAACVAPKPSAEVRLNSTGSIAKMCRAPASRAPCTAAEPSPPTPTTGARVPRPAPARVYGRAPAGRDAAPGEARGLGPEGRVDGDHRCLADDGVPGVAPDQAGDRQVVPGEVAVP